MNSTSKTSHEYKLVVDITPAYTLKVSTSDDPSKLEEVVQEARFIVMMHTFPSDQVRLECQSAMDSGRFSLYHNNEKIYPPSQQVSELEEEVVVAEDPIEEAIDSTEEISSELDLSVEPASNSLEKLETLVNERTMTLTELQSKREELLAQLSAVETEIEEYAPQSAEEAIGLIGKLFEDYTFTGELLTDNTERLISVWRSLNDSIPSD